MYDFLKISKLAVPSQSRAGLIPASRNDSRKRDRPAKALPADFAFSNTKTTSALV